jgi:hypothetical protein
LDQRAQDALPDYADAPAYWLTNVVRMLGDLGD